MCADVHGLDAATVVRVDGGISQLPFRIRGVAVSKGRVLMGSDLVPVDLTNESELSKARSRKDVVQ